MRPAKERERRSLLRDRSPPDEEIPIPKPVHVPHFSEDATPELLASAGGRKWQVREAEPSSGVNYEELEPRRRRGGAAYHRRPQLLCRVRSSDAVTKSKLLSLSRVRPQPSSRVLSTPGGGGGGGGESSGWLSPLPSDPPAITPASFAREDVLRA